MGTTGAVIGYVRVSTLEQGATGAGLEAQRTSIKAECERRGWRLLRIEEDVQSGKSLQRREGLKHTLTALDKGEATGLVVAKLDRLSRSLADFAAIVERSRKRGWEVVVLDLNVDTTTPTGEAMASMLAVFSQWERRMIGQRTKDALAVKRKQGVQLGRPRVVDPITRRRIKTLRSRGWSFGRIAAKLNEERVPTGHGGARWYPATVSKIVSAEVTR